MASKRGGSEVGEGAHRGPGPTAGQPVRERAEAVVWLTVLVSGSPSTLHFGPGLARLRPTPQADTVWVRFGADQIARSGSVIKLPAGAPGTACGPWLLANSHARPGVAVASRSACPR